MCTAAPSPRALSPATLASLAEQLGGDAEIVPEPRAALARARELAGPEGAVDRDGIHLPHRGARLRTRGQEGLCTVNERGPSVIGMIALVAVVVALTILIFFALGYAFGRMFL